MGLHDSLLNVPERLRVWQQAGVRYLYLDPDAVPVPDAVPAAPDTAAPAEARRGAPAPLAATVADPAPAARPRPDIPADPARWPEPWPAIYARTPPNPRIVITYAALGQDLTGRADPRRGRLWRTLIGKLGLTGKNAVAFWPMALPESPDPDGDLERFVAGCGLLAPRLVAVFGDAAACLVRPCAPRLAGAALACFSDPQPLLRGDAEAWSHVLSVLGAC